MLNADPTPGGLFSLRREGTEPQTYQNTLAGARPTQTKTTLNLSMSICRDRFDGAVLAPCGVSPLPPTVGAFCSSPVHCVACRCASVHLRPSRLSFTGRFLTPDESRRIFPSLSQGPSRRLAVCPLRSPTLLRAPRHTIVVAKTPHPPPLPFLLAPWLSIQNDNYLVFVSAVTTPFAAFAPPFGPRRESCPFDQHLLHYAHQRHTRTRA